MYRGEPPKSPEEHIFDLTDRMERVEKRTQQPTPLALPVYIQSTAPLNVPLGTLWLDTNSTCDE